MAYDVLGRADLNNEEDDRPWDHQGEWVLIGFLRHQKAELGTIRGTHRERDVVSNFRMNFQCVTAV